MKRTTISLPDDLAKALEREARRRRVSISHVVRDGLETHLGRSGARRQIPFAAVGRSGQRNTARNVDTILSAEWQRDRSR